MAGDRWSESILIAIAWKHLKLDVEYRRWLEHKLRRIRIGHESGIRNDIHDARDLVCRERRFECGIERNHDQQQLGSRLDVKSGFELAVGRKWNRQRRLFKLGLGSKLDRLERNRRIGERWLVKLGVGAGLNRHRENER